MIRVTGITIALTLLLAPLSFVDAAVFENPLLLQFVREILRGSLQAVIYVGTPAVIVLVVWTGFMFIAAQGDGTLLVSAKKQLLITLLAATLLFSLWALVELVGNTLAGLSTAGLLLVLGAFFLYVKIKQ